MFDKLELLIQLHRLEGFFWVARTGGYAKAARSFPYPITQPGIHQQVKKLEGDLGHKLFERTGKDTVVPTPQGRALYEFCAPFFEQLPEVVRMIRGAQFGGELRIDGVGLTVRGILPVWVKRIRERHPDIRVRLSQITGSGLDRLRRGESDLFVDFLETTPDDMESQVVGVAHAFLVVPSDHPRAQKKNLHVRDMADAPFVSYPPGSSHERLQLAGLAQVNIAPRDTVAAPSVDSILAFVQAGLGYSLVPWLSEAGPRQAGVRAVKLTGRGARFPIAATWRVTPYKNPLVDAALASTPT